jgi:hypothetical protein
MLMEEWTAALGFDATPANREQHCWLYLAVCVRHLFSSATRADPSWGFALAQAE